MNVYYLSWGFIMFPQIVQLVEYTDFILQKSIPLTTNECPRYEYKQSDGEAPGQKI